MKRKIKNDLLIILVPLILCISYALWVNYSHKTGGYVYVEQDGDGLGAYPLNEDVEVTFENENGGYNILVIKDGKADIISASCPDKVCVNHRKIGFEGESIVCLPNRLTVRITKTGEQSSAPDLVP